TELAQRGAVPLVAAAPAASAASVAAALVAAASPLQPAAPQDATPQAATLQPATPQVATPPPFHPAEAAFAAPATPHAFASAANPNAQVDADWRQRYYRNVVWKRAGAIVLDYVFAVLVGGIILAVLNRGEDEVAAVVIVAVFYLLLPAFEASVLRATPGKWLMKLQITDEQGHRIGFMRAFFRNLLRSIVLYSYVLVVPLLLQWWRFKKTKKLFHDQMSSTVIGERLSRGGSIKPEMAAGGA
ncbi:MAG: RDD family protein, partial [Rubrivivax sp.]